MSIYEDWEEVTFRSQLHLNDGSGYVPWGTGLVEGAKDLAGRAVNQLQEWAEEDPDTWTDDALRLMGRGVQGAGRAMGDWERRSEEGEIGLRSAAGTALRFMNWSSEQGARLGRTGARAVGVNEELGGFLGSFIPEAIGTKGLSKAAQIAKTTKQLRKLRKLGALPMELDAATIGKYSFAFGDKAEGLGSDLVKATKGSFRKGTDKKLAALETALDFKLIKGSSKAAQESQKTLRRIIANDIDNFKGSIDDIKRNQWGIVDNAGDAREVIGLHAYKATGDPNVLKFRSIKQRLEVGRKRALRMQPPADEIKALAKELGLPEEVVESYLKSTRSGFAGVQEAARRNSIPLTEFYKELRTGKLTPRSKKALQQYDAGHFFSTKSSTGPGALDRAPTSRRSARVESQFKNRSGGAKIEHDINQHAAQIARIPRNWREDFLLHVDELNGIPGYASNYNRAQMDLIEAIPASWSKAKVEGYFEAVIEPLTKQGDVRTADALFQEASGISRTARRGEY